MEEQSHLIKTLEAKKLALEIASLQKPFYKNIRFWISILGILIVLISGLATEFIRDAINRSNLKTQEFQTISADLSNYLIISNNYVLLLKQGVVDKKVFDYIEPLYNQAALKARTKRPYNYALIHSFWNKKLADQYNDLLNEISDFSAEVHRLYPFFIALNENRIKKIEVAQVQNILDNMDFKIQNLQVSIRKFLMDFASASS